MKTHRFLSLTVLTLCAASFLPAASARAADPDADQLLRQMSEKLASAKTLSFSATREIDAALLEGRQLAEKARITVTVQRPDKIAAIARSKEGTRHLVADGRTLSLFDAKNNYYTALPMRADLDTLVARLDEKYGFTPPLAEFALSNPYADFRRQARTLTYLGRAKTKAGFLGLGGVECHRLALSGPLAQAELWIGVHDQLPRQLVATFNREGRPQVRIRFSEWNLAAPVAATDFIFTPPPGSEKIEMWTTAEMDATRSR
jgi:hypothetical protein